MQTQSAIRTLNVLSNPSDLPGFDTEYLWRQFGEVLQSFASRGVLRFDRLQPPSANALRSALNSVPYTVVHLVVHGHERVSARYGTIALETFDGRAAHLTVQALSAMQPANPSPALVILQSAIDGDPCFDLATQEILAAHKDVTVLTVPRLQETSQKAFLLKAYSGLLAGLSADQLAADLAAAARSAPGLELICIECRDGKRAMLAASPATGSAQHASPPPDPLSQPVPAWQEAIRRKRAADTFDVFLCHNVQEKPAILRIEHQLREKGFLCWLDVDELTPGKPWQELIEQQILKTRAAAVCIGASGLGPWQRRELYAFLELFVRHGIPVIPVLLPDAPSAPDLPVFLAGMGWVDFRRSDLDPLARLIWGITGIRPDF